MQPPGWAAGAKENYILDKNGNRIGSQGVEAGLLNILGVDAATARRMMKGAGMTEKGTDIWWAHEGNQGKAITTADEQYRGIYEKRLASENTLTIYNRLVAAGKMERNEQYSNNAQSWWYGALSFVGLGDAAESRAGSKYISYEQYKANNFTQGRPEVDIGVPIREESEISAVFGATGNASRNPHRGIDFAVAGRAVYPIFANETTSARVFDEARDLGSPQGLHVNLVTDVTYTFKGEQRTDQILQRMLHLDSASVRGGQEISINTLLGVSGNTGWLQGKGYGYHLHLDRAS